MQGGVGGYGPGYNTYGYGNVYLETTISIQKTKFMFTSLIGLVGSGTYGIGYGLNGAGGVIG